MMPPNRTEIKDFLDRLHIFSGQRILHPSELVFFLESISSGTKQEIFKDLVFQAKFVTKTQEVMKRIGVGANGFEKLSNELQTGVSKSVALMKELSKDATWEKQFQIQFLSSDGAGLQRFMEFLGDLSWVKNWQVDGNPMPYDTRWSAGVTSNLQRNQKQLVRTSILAYLLFVAFLFIDPPATTLGWILSLGILVMLSYIVFELLQQKKSH